MADNREKYLPELVSDRFPSHYGDSFNNSEDTLWLKLTPKTFKPNITATKNINGGGSATRQSLWFLLSSTFSIGLQHQWDEETSISGALRELKTQAETQAAKLFAETGGGITLAGKRFNDQYAGGISSKNDTPFIYKNTTRRNFTVEVNFSAYTSSEKEVWNPIQTLMIWSAADGIGDGSLATQFYFPYVFKLETITGSGKLVDIVNFENAALEQVTPTFNQPYIQGYPSSASVSLTFTDIQPVYASSISSKGRSGISVGTETTDIDSRSTARRRAAQLKTNTHIRSIPNPSTLAEARKRVTVEKIKTRRGGSE